MTFASASSRGLLRDCKTSNFAKVWLQLYCGSCLDYETRVVPLDNEVRVQSDCKVFVRNFGNILDIHSNWHSDWLDRGKLKLETRWLLLTIFKFVNHMQFLTLPWHNHLEDRWTWPRPSCRGCGCGRGCAGRPRRWWRGGILPVVSENLYENILKTGRKVFANISLSQKVWWSLLWRNLIPTIYSTNPQ